MLNLFDSSCGHHESHEAPSITEADLFVCISILCWLFCVLIDGDGTLLINTWLLGSTQMAGEEEEEKWADKITAM